MTSDRPLGTADEQRRSYIWCNRGNCLGKMCSLGKNLDCLGEKVGIFVTTNQQW